VKGGAAHGQDGHAGTGHTVEHGVNHQLHPDSHLLTRPRRPLRCLRHRVWMAACDDCRTAHTARLLAATTPVPTGPDPEHGGTDDAGH
jgi:hypothetical protein